MDGTLETQIEPQWENVRKLRERICGELESCPSELRGSAVMAASELVENAIKYGETLPGVRPIEVSLRMQDQQLTITVSNPCTNVEKLHRLEEHIKKMKSREETGNLYLRRLEEILHEPNQPPRLGLYRVGFEGHFELEYSYEAQVVRIKATRSIS